jgi:hypothetical protein
MDVPYRYEKSVRDFVREVSTKMRFFEYRGMRSTGIQFLRAARVEKQKIQFFSHERRRGTRRARGQSGNATKQAEINQTYAQLDTIVH